MFVPIRDALSPLPDRTAARRLAIAAGVTTGGLVIAAIAVLIHASDVDPTRDRSVHRARDRAARVASAPE